jgi:hypothetical protein
MLQKLLALSINKAQKYFTCIRGNVFMWSIHTPSPHGMQNLQMSVCAAQYLWETQFFYKVHTLFSLLHSIMYSHIVQQTCTVHHLMETLHLLFFFFFFTLDWHISNHLVHHLGLQ